MERPWYIEERAVQLAIVHLTRCNDLKVTPRSRHEHGQPDLLVSILQEGRDTGRRFAVETDATVSELAPKKVSEDAYNNVPFPVCLFFFTMQDDDAYYRWIKEPTLLETGAILRSQSGTLQPLTDAEMDNIVRRINNWYDARKVALEVVG